MEEEDHSVLMRYGMILGLIASQRWGVEALV
jgi:hypothetical protein